MEIDEYLDKLICNGSNIDKELLKKEVQFYLKNKNMYDAIDNVLNDIEESTYKYMKSKTVNGVSTTIYLKDQFFLNISTGHSVHSNYINTYTEFDIASITKLFTLLLIFRYEELGLINLNDKVSDINANFKYLDYTILDIIKMAGSIITDIRIDSALNELEALKILRSVHPVNYDLSVNHYTDIGFMVLSKIIEDISGNTYLEVMKQFLLKYGIKINSGLNIAGNGHLDFMPHDPKARVFKSAIGSSGIFINSINMAKFAQSIFNCKIISQDNLDKLSKKLFKLYHDNRGYAGINIKHPLGIKKSATPNEYSNKSFSHQGFTGSSVIFDPINQIYNSIFVDAINLNEKGKHKDFFKYYNLYHQEIVMNTLKIYLIKNYYDIDEKDNIKMLKII